MEKKDEKTKITTFDYGEKCRVCGEKRLLANSILEEEKKNGRQVRAGLKTAVLAQAVGIMDPSLANFTIPLLTYNLDICRKCGFVRCFNATLQIVPNTQNIKMPPPGSNT